MSNAHDAWRSLSGRQRKRLTQVIYDRDAGICHLCRLPVRREDASVDHVIPLSKGGPSTMANLKLAHRRCNSAKGNRVWTGRRRFVVDGLDWFESRRDADFSEIDTSVPPRALVPRSLPPNKEKKPER